MFRLAAALFLLCAGAAAAQVTPAPLAPPISPPPPAPANTAVSPILLHPGPLYAAPSGPHPTFPGTPSSSPIDQQKLQSYGSGLAQERRNLERNGISAADTYTREIQSEINRLNAGPPPHRQ